ncbi:hypothetical protein ACI77O_13370 [Pseudomonas tritici]|uniref:hypothetical protein n=1 Tax=Pseudomonas tritici TaxID=2745518 RepID=UPI00387B62D4
MLTIRNNISNLTAHLNAVTWQRQSLLCCTVFWLATLASSYPAMEGGLSAWSVNQCLEDFGVFLLFFSIWCGFYAHFERSASLPWLLMIMAVAFWQEEINLFNKIYQSINIWLDIEFTYRERQRGDVTMLMIISLSLLARFLQPGFKSFFRIHITAFLLFFTCFQLWLHYTFPYQIQSAILAPYVEYQKEFSSTYEGRFRYQCDQGVWVCYSWEGDNIPDSLRTDADLMALIKSHDGIVMNTAGYVGNAEHAEDVFRGFSANQKFIVTYYKNHDLNRVVINHEFTERAVEVVTRPLVIFSASFGMVWFFGGLMIVLMHQRRSPSKAK